MSITMDGLSGMKIYNKFNIEIGSLDTNPTYVACKKIVMKPTRRQKRILHLWFDTCREMMNITLTYLRNTVKTHDIKTMRDLFRKSKNIKNNINYFNKFLNKIKNRKKTFLGKLNNLKIKVDKKRNDKRLLKKYSDEITKLNLNIKLTSAMIENLTKEYLNSYDRYKNLSKNINELIKFENVRDKLYSDKHSLIDKNFKNNEEERILVHVVDCAIQEVCNMYKSNKTGYMKGQKNTFKIKYFNKKNKFMDFELSCIKKYKDGTNQICPNVFGKMKYFYNENPYNIGTYASQMHYNVKTKVYTLLIAEKLQKSNSKSKKFIAIDEGIRTFCTGITDNGVVKIGKNIGKQN